MLLFNGRKSSVIIGIPAATLTRRRFQIRAAAIDALETRRLLTSVIVNTTADTPVTDSTITGQTVSLREAVNYENANGGGTISFAASLTTSAPATITLATSGDGTAGPSDLGIDDVITIVGPTGSNGITIANSGAQRLFYIDTSASLTLQNLTLSGGDAVGGAADHGGAAAGLGGAIFNAGTLNIVQSTLQSNSAQGGGSGGGAFGGGGLGGDAVGENDGGPPNGGGGAGGFGGGGGGGSAGGFGGGGGFGLNGGFGGGGGAGSNGGFGGGSGGGGVNGGGGAGMGGAIFNYGGSVTLTNSTLALNSALGGGSGNNGQGLGGAIFNLNGSITSNDSTLAFNTAPDGGGAIYDHSEDPANVGSQTGGPTLPSSYPATTLNNSILADSNDGSGTPVADYAFSSGINGNNIDNTGGTNNLIENGSASFTANGAPADTLTGDPNLVGTAPANNGGPTDTFALPDDSPAIGAGSAAVNQSAGITTDQRGEHRYDPPTLGALEPGVPGSLTVNTTTDLLGGTGPSNSLREAVEYANQLGGNQTITFAPSLTTSAPATITLAISGDGTAGPSDLPINASITIVGPTGNNGITIANSGARRLFYIDTSASLTLENLTLSGGDAVGGDASGFSGSGGGAGLGGAIFNAGTLSIVGSTLQSNIAQGGGGAGEGGGGGGGGLAGNGTDEDGGGPNGGGVGEDGGFGGGGGRAGNGGFGGGGAGESGGAGGFGGGGGSGHDGGAGPGPGGFGAGSGVGANGGGGGAGMGGAIFNYGGSVTLTNATLSNNSALGGIGTSNGQGLGGAIFNLNGSVTSDDSTLAFNTAPNGGGAIYNHGDTPADVGSQTGGPALPSSAATVTLNNSILADSNDGTATLVNDFDGSSSNTGSNSSNGTNNLIETGSANFSPTTGAPATLTGDPNFVGSSPANNGGPTPTFALANASPAIGAGSASANQAAGITTDQRGKPRNTTTPDLGALEVQPAIIATGNKTFTSVEGSSTGTVTVATFTDPNGASAANTYTADINWQDGSAITHGAITLANGVYTVKASHTYASFGTGVYHPTVVIHHSGESDSNTVTDTANVTPVPITATAVTFTGTEGRLFNGNIANFTTTRASAAAGDYTATIDWGDGHVDGSTITVVKDGTGHFHIMSSHRYAQESTSAGYKVKVTIHRVGMVGNNTLVTSTAKIADAILDQQVGLNLTESVNATLTNLALGSFRDQDSLNTNPANYTGTIDWGDGTATTAAKFVFTGSKQDVGGNWQVQGTHKYTSKKTFTVKITLHDNDTPGVSLVITTSIKIV